MCFKFKRKQKNRSQTNYIKDPINQMYQQYPIPTVQTERYRVDSLPVGYTDYYQYPVVPSFQADPFLFDNNFGYGLNYNQDPRMYQQIGYQYPVVPSLQADPFLFDNNFGYGLNYNQDPRMYQQIGYQNYIKCQLCQAAYYNSCPKCQRAYDRDYRLLY